MSAHRYGSLGAGISTTLRFLFQMGGHVLQLSVVQPVVSERVDTRSKHDAHRVPGATFRDNVYPHGIHFQFIEGYEDGSLTISAIENNGQLPARFVCHRVHTQVDLGLLFIDGERRQLADGLVHRHEEFLPRQIRS